jgi:CBS domain-containing protein
MRVAALMRSHVVSLTADATLRELADVFDVYQQPVVPIVDAAECFIGVVTPITLLRRLCERYAEHDLAETLMDTECCTAGEDDAISDVARALLECGHPAAVVLDDRKVIGIIGQGEACRGVIEDRLETSAATARSDACR